MAMPRYKYAIGNAPVRFPSAAKDDGNVPAGARPRNDSLQSQQAAPTERPTRWSVMSLVRGADLEPPSDKQVKKTRSQQNLRSASGGSQASNGTLGAAVDDEAAGIRRSTSAQAISKEAERIRSTSLLEAPSKTLPSHARVKKGGDASPALRSSMASLRGEIDVHPAAKRVSWITPFDSGSRSSSRASSVRGDVEATEQSSLLAREMSQPRPTSLRPSSLFWTDIGNEATSSRKGAAPSDARRGSSASARSYGATSPTLPATEPAVAAPNKDDPYGFRAMAGPVLLPLFHEQQRKASQAAAPPTLLGSATRSCASPWRWVSFLALLALSAVITYITLF